MKNKFLEDILKILGVITIMTFAGVGLYSGTHWLSYSEDVILVNAVHNNGTNVFIYQNTNDDTRLDIYKYNPNCPGNLSKWIITDDKSKVKCGNRIQYEWQTYIVYEKFYGEDENITNTRKKRSISIDLINSTYDCSFDYIDNKTGKNITVKKECEFEDRVEVSKYVEYYKGRQSKLANNLKEVYIATEYDVKLNYYLESYHTSKNIIKLCFSRFDDSIIGFDGLEEYKVEMEGSKKCYYYGYKKGDLFIDPAWTDAPPSEGDVWLYNRPENLSTISIDTSNATTQYNATAINGVTFEKRFDGNNTMTFDGVNQYTTTDSTIDFGTGDFSLSAWVNYSTVAENYNLDLGYRFDNSMTFYVKGTGELSGISRLGSSNHAFVSGKFVSANTWHHIVITRSGTTIKMYLDNSSPSTDTHANNALDLNQKLSLGYAPQRNVGVYFDGQMSNVLLYNKSLNTSEISDLYALGCVNLFAGIINYTLLPGEIIYVANISLYINQINFTSGNYTWNFSQAGITSYNTTTYLYNVSNGGTTKITVQLKDDTYQSYRDWVCENTSITGSYKDVINVTSGNWRGFNCTLSLLNCNRTYVDFIPTIDNCNLTITPNFNEVET